jgi:glutamate decarboxylase
VLRVVVRNGFSADLGDQLVTDLRHAIAELERQPAPLSRPDAAFHH